MKTVRYSVIFVKQSAAARSTSRARLSMFFFFAQERSCVYERLVECEEMAKGAKRGLHSAKEPPANRINDVSQPGNATK